MNFIRPFRLFLGKLILLCDNCSIHLNPLEKSFCFDALFLHLCRGDLQRGPQRTRRLPTTLELREADLQPSLAAGKVAPLLNDKPFGGLNGDQKGLWRHKDLSFVGARQCAAEGRGDHVDLR